MIQQQSVYHKDTRIHTPTKYRQCNIYDNDSSLAEQAFQRFVFWLSSDVLSADRIGVIPVGPIGQAQNRIKLLL